MARRNQVEVEEPEEEQVEVVATRKKRRASQDEDTEEAVEMHTPDYSSVMDDLEKHYSLSAESMDPVARRSSTLSTGMLVTDLIMGGGIFPGGWYTIFGPEQSCKSTQTMTILGAAAKADLPLCVIADYEGSTSPGYISTMWSNLGLDTASLFGVKDAHGKWTVEPKVRYYSMSVGEKFFDMLSAVLRRLPNKEFMDGTWYFVYENTKENRKIVGDSYSKKLFSRYNAFYVPAPDGKPQALFIVDSYPAMLPGKQDVDDPNNSIAVQARMFSDNLKKVKGKLRGKAVTVIGVNQLRKIPMAMYGPTEMEPCGEALKFFCMAPETLLYTEKGLLKAEEMQHVLPKNLCGMSGVEKPEVFQSMGYSQTLEIVTKSGYSIKGKPGHAVLTLTENSLTPEYIALEKFNTYKGMYVAVKVGANIFPKKNPTLEFTRFGLQTQGEEKAKITFPKIASVDLAYVLGALAGDGYVRNGAIGLVGESLEVLNKFKACFDAVFGVTTKPPHRASTKTISKDSKVKVVGYSSVDIGGFLAYLGLGNKSSHQKEVPWVIRQGTKDVQAAFLAGIADTDGFATMSKNLFQQMIVMLLNFGIVASRAGGKDNWTNHGLYLERDSVDSRSNLTRSTNGHNDSCFGITVYPPFTHTMQEEIGKYQANQYRLDRRQVWMDKSDVHQSKFTEVYSGFGKYGACTTLFKLPTTDKPWRSETSKLMKMFKSLPTESRGQSTNVYYDKERVQIIIPGLRKVAAEYATPQEREVAVRALDRFQSLVDFTHDNGLVWVEVDAFHQFTERVMTYDGNMPDTHTIITNGIVSHNSDFRMKQTPRAASAAGFVADKGKGGMVYSEESVDGGVDTYRMVYMKAEKNKLSQPGIEGFSRLWIADSDGVARGFDPVYDTFSYLQKTGQVTGNMKKMVIRMGNLEIGPINWMTFKKLVLLSGKALKEACVSNGITKPPKLRERGFDQLRSGSALDLYAVAKKSADSNAKEEEDDE